MPWLVVLEKNDASPEQESSAQTVQGRGSGVETNCAKSARSQREMDIELAMPVCGEEGILQKGTNLDGNGW